MLIAYAYWTDSLLGALFGGRRLGPKCLIYLLTASPIFSTPVDSPLPFVCFLFYHGEHYLSIALILLLCLSCLKVWKRPNNDGFCCSMR